MDRHHTFEFVEGTHAMPISPGKDPDILLPVR